MASAAAAKKWPRLSQRTLVGRADQPEVRLVDQGGRLQGVVGGLVRPCGRRRASAARRRRAGAVGGGLGVARGQVGQDARDFVHGRLPKCRWTNQSAATFIRWPVSGRRAFAGASNLLNSAFDPCRRKLSMSLSASALSDFGFSTPCLSRSRSPIPRSPRMRSAAARAVSCVGLIDRCRIPAIFPASLFERPPL